MNATRGFSTMGTSLLLPLGTEADQQSRDALQATKNHAPMISVACPQPDFHHQSSATTARHYPSDVCSEKANYAHDPSQALPLRDHHYWATYQALLGRPTISACPRATCRRCRRRVWQQYGFLRPLQLVTRSNPHN